MNSPADRDLGVLASSSLIGAVRAVCLGSQEGKPHPVVYQTQHDQPVKNMVVLLYPVLVLPCSEHRAELCAVLGPTI